MPTWTRRGGWVALVAALTATIIGTPTSASGEELPKVTVKITKAGCPATLKVASGPITFTISRDNKTRVDEFEILDGDVVVTEVEGLQPGQSSTFSVTLRPGTFTTYCPLGARERGSLVVTGTPAPDLGPQSQAAVDAYRSYLVDQMAMLVSSAQVLDAAVKRGDTALAKQAYVAARQPYERIEPVAEQFGDLDPRIDARKGDVPASRWGGFHRIEQALWVNNNTNLMGPVSTRLAADSRELAGYIPDMNLEPATIATGAAELLNEVSTTKITGEEERYSHTDLVDLEANVEGASAAFDAIRPLVGAADPQLVATIDQRFADVTGALEGYRRDDSFVSYKELKPADTRKLSQLVDALAEPLSTVSKLVIAARAS